MDPKEKIIHTVINNKLTYLSYKHLDNIYKEIKNINKLEGIIVEAGCALGGSAIVIANAKSKDKKFKIYDIFGMIPPPSKKDGDDVKKRYEIIRSGKSKGIGGDTYYGYRDNLLDIVKNNFSICNVNLDNSIEFIKGLYQDTLIIDEPVCMAHIDCDWYESVMICLEQIIPNLVVRGKVIIDDYNTWSGCKYAVDDYFSDPNFKSKFKFNLGEKLVIEKIRM